MSPHTTVTSPSIPTSTSTTPKARDPLPNEILHAILVKLAQPELLVCIRTSRLFYLVATPLIYKSLYIDLTEDINPLVIRRPRLKSRLGKRINSALAKMGLKDKAAAAKAIKEKQGIFGMAKAREARTTISQPIPIAPLVPIPSRFSWTTHLEITTHSYTTCASLPPLITPVLQDLRIRPGYQQNHLNFCACRHYTEETGRCTASPTCLCPLFSRLSPRRLLIGDDTSGLSGSAAGLTTSDVPFPPPAIQEVVVFAGACSGIEIGPEADSYWLEQVPPTVEKLTIVMQPREGLWAMHGRWRFRRVAGFEDCFEADLRWKKLAIALSGQAGSLEVVGVETIDRDWTELPVKEEEAEIRMAVMKKLVEKGWTRADAEARGRGISFISRCEFDEREKKRGGREAGRSIDLGAE